MPLPPIITMDVAAKALGWTVQRARRWLTKAGVVAKENGRWITTPTKLIDKLPDFHEALLDYFAQAPDIGEHDNGCPNCDALRGDVQELERQMVELGRRLQAAEEGRRR